MTIDPKYTKINITLHDNINHALQLQPCKSTKQCDMMLDISE